MSPHFCRVHEMMENCASNSHQKQIAVRTVGAMNGSNMMARISDFSLMLRFSSNASHSPNPNFNVQAMTVYRNVLLTDSQKTLSPNSDRKFSSPMKTPDCPILVSV